MASSTQGQPGRQGRNVASLSRARALRDPPSGSLTQPAAAAAAAPGTHRRLTPTCPTLPAKPLLQDQNSKQYNSKTRMLCPPARSVSPTTAAARSNWLISSSSRRVALSVG